MEVVFYICCVDWLYLSGWSCSRSIPRALREILALWVLFLVVCIVIFVVRSRCSRSMWVIWVWAILNDRWRCLYVKFVSVIVYFLVSGIFEFFL